jgi:excisionase family DNA binding protein
MLKRLTKEETCEALGISQTTLYRMIKSGRFPEGTRIGRKVFWYAQTVEKFDRMRQKASENGWRAGGINGGTSPATL